MIIEIYACKNVDPEEKPKETDAVEEALKTVSSLSFLNTSTRSKNREKKLVHFLLLYITCDIT